MVEMQEYPKISIVIISYNTRDLTLACIRSVFTESKSNNYEIIVFDNNSNDGSADAIEAEFVDTITLVRSEKNLGFAAGNNEAVKKVSGEYIVLLNPDTVVLNSAIDALLEFAEENASSKIWGGRTVFADGRLNARSCWGKQTLWGLVCQVLGLTSVFSGITFFNPEVIGGWDRNGDRSVDIVSGCFLMIKHTFWNDLGGFDQAFFMYGEEADLCLRAKKSDAHPAVTSKATIIHIGGASEKHQPDKLIRLIKSKSLLIERHFTKNTIKPGLYLLSLWPLSRYVMHSVASKLGRRTSIPKSLVWRSVWQQRRQWRNLS